MLCNKKHGQLDAIRKFFWNINIIIDNYYIIKAKK